MIVNKIQSLVIKQLMEHGSVTLILPDGMVLTLGVTQEGQTGKMEKVENYCWVQASQHERGVSLDSYNVGLQYVRAKDKHVCSSETYDVDGREIIHLDVV